MHPLLVIDSHGCFPVASVLRREIQPAHESHVPAILYHGVGPRHISARTPGVFSVRIPQAFVHSESLADTPLIFGTTAESQTYQKAYSVVALVRPTKIQRAVLGIMCRAGLYYPPARLLLDEQLPLWHRSTTGVSNAISAGKAQLMKPQSWVKTELGPREHMSKSISLLKTSRK